MLFKIFGSETGGALAVVEHPVGPHRLIPHHTHSDVDEYSYVSEGEIGARLGDRVITAGPGSYVLKSRGIMHAFWNATDRPARILEILSPAEFEKFFEVMGDLMKHPGPDTPQASASSPPRIRMCFRWIGSRNSSQPKS